jgi:hypothetical protein
MIKVAFVLAVAAAVLTTAPLLVGAVPAEAQNLRMAQGVDVQVGRDRDDRGRGDRVRGDRDRRDSDRGDRDRRRRDGVGVRVGPGGVTVGQQPRERCRTVTTTVERNGRTVTRKERVCD